LRSRNRGRCPRRGRRGKAAEAIPKVSDLKFAKTSTAAFPLWPCGPPPPITGEAVKRREEERSDSRRLARRPHAGEVARGIGVGRKIGLAARLVEMGEGPHHGWKRELLPGNVVPVEQGHLLALGTRGHVGVDQACAVHD